MWGALMLYSCKLVFVATAITEAFAAIAVIFVSLIPISSDVDVSDTLNNLVYEPPVIDNIFFELNDTASTLS